MRAVLRIMHRDSPWFACVPSGSIGWAPALIENFGEGRYLGVPLLQRYGMAVEPRLALERGVEPYPHMIRWIR